MATPVLMLTVRECSADRVRGLGASIKTASESGKGAAFIVKGSA